MLEKDCQIIDPKTVITTYKEKDMTIKVKSIFSGNRNATDLIAPAIITKLKSHRALQIVHSPNSNV